MHRTALLYVCLLLSPTLLPAQTTTDLFRDIVVLVDTARFERNRDGVLLQGRQQVPFVYTNTPTTIELRLYPAGRVPISGVELLPTKGVEVIDSLLNYNGLYYRTRLRFADLLTTDLLRLTFRVRSNYFTDAYLYEVPLLPIYPTRAALPPGEIELFVGEEKTVPIATDQADNLQLPTVWTQGQPVNYKFSRPRDQVLLHLQAERPGDYTLSVPLGVRRPLLDRFRRPVYALPPLRARVRAGEARLTFLEPDQRVFPLNERGRTHVELELQSHPDLRLKKTYRLEAQEDPGGALVAEIFTRNRLGNGKVLCDLRLYDFHRRSDGYLYLKDGDMPAFITNFSVVPQTKIESVWVRREGGDWQPGTGGLLPGETIELELRGQALHRGRFTFDGLAELRPDTLLATETERRYRATVPVTIDRKQVDILNYGKPTERRLPVREYRRPHPLDFVYYEYNGRRIRATEVTKLLFVDNTLEELLVRFDPALLESVGDLYGPQHLDVEVKVLNTRNTVVDQRTLEDVLVCPGAASPRYGLYDQTRCRTEPININQLLRNKTYDLEDWSVIEVKVKHREAIYTSKGFERVADFVLRKKTTFNIDVSFPAGLIVKRVNEEGFGNLGGVSLAMIAQFTFYHPDRINKTKPFKFGAGFLAFNAFNFSENSSRDVGIVALGSLYPIRRPETNRLSFPIYMGGGYFLSEQKWFVLIGPGIRVQL